MRIVCTSCHKRFTAQKIGVGLLEVIEETRPYRLWSADLLECGCGKQIVCTANNPSAHDTEAGDHAKRLEEHGVVVYQELG